MAVTKLSMPPGQVRDPIDLDVQLLSQGGELRVSGHVHQQLGLTGHEVRADERTAGLGEHAVGAAARTLVVIGYVQRAGGLGIYVEPL